MGRQSRPARPAPLLPAPDAAQSIEIVNRTALSLGLGSRRSLRGRQRLPAWDQPASQPTRETGCLSPRGHCRNGCGMVPQSELGQPLLPPGIALVMDSEGAAA